MSDAFNIFAASKHYSDLLDSFSCGDRLRVNLNNATVSEAIYFHICKMKYAGWRHRVHFKRSKKYSISDVFQDTVAFYLKATLPSDYIVELEKKIKHTQTDIAIKRGDNYVFLIETKTNIGWDRPNTELNDPYKKMRDRINELSANFAVPPENIIYVFEEHSNVSMAFSEKFWDSRLQKSKPRPTEFPFSVIFPLFNATDPYYWKHKKGLKRNIEYEEISDEEIKAQAKRNIVTPFEEILRRIMPAA